MRATARPISPEVRRTTAQNLKPHARRRMATATIHDGTEAGLFLNTDSIGSRGLVSKRTIVHEQRLTGPVVPCLPGERHDTSDAVMPAQAGIQRSPCLRPCSKSQETKSVTLPRTLAPQRPCGYAGLIDSEEVGAWRTCLSS